MASFSITIFYSFMSVITILKVAVIRCNDVGDDNHGHILPTVTGKIYMPYIHFYFADNFCELS